MSIESCIPIIPSVNLEKSLRLWIDGLEFDMSREMRSPEEGIRLYWAPGNIHEIRKRLIGLGYSASEICERDCGQTEFFLTDDDGFTHCFGVPTKTAV